MGDAMFGLSQNPMQAIERLAAMGYPEEAAALQQQVGKQQVAEQEAQTDAARVKIQDFAAKSVDRARRFDDVQDLRKSIQQDIGAALNQGMNPQDIIISYARVAKANGFDLYDDFGLHPGMSPEALVAYADGNMTRYNQLMLPLTERRVRTNERNAQTAAQRAASSAAAARERLRNQREAEEGRNRRHQENLEYRRENPPGNRRSPPSLRNPSTNTRQPEIRSW
jgi:hypothetical protein